METMDCILGRTCVRRFKSDDVVDAVLDDILKAAVASPSAGNCQDWEFVVVREPGNRAKLAEASMGQGMVKDAPVSIVVCANLKKIGRYGTRGEELYSIQDSAAAAQNIMLAAWDKGIGSCWIGAFDEGKVRQLLVLPEHVRPMAIIPLGYPAEKPAKPERWPMKDFVHREHF